MKTRPSAGLRDRRRAEIRRDLRRATLELILEEGPGGASVTDICARAGLARRTFFNHFSARDEAIVGWGSFDADVVRADVVALDPRFDARGAVRAGLRAVLEQLVEDPLWDLEIEALRRFPELRGLFFNTSRHIEQALDEALQVRASRGAPAHEAGFRTVRPEEARRLALLAITGTGALRLAISAWMEDPELSPSRTLDDLLGAEPVLAHEPSESG